MTLSNFDWTDKNSVKWFILLPTGHEGPYSMNQLLQMKDNKKIAPHVTIWAEGISVPKTLAEIEKEIFEEKLIETDELPLLPEEDIPPLPVDELYPVEKKPLKNPKWIFIVLGILGLLFFFFTHIVTKRESGLVIKRHPKMSLNLLQRIEKENAFKGWEAPLFFKEYLPGDHSQIWLVTSSFHECDVEASFQSIKDKLLSPSEESISFRSKAPLSGHVVELSRFEFMTGNKVVPGLYEMDLKATHCRWNGLLPKVMNKFSEPDSEYLARTRVVLFSQGPVEFNKVLDRLLISKVERDMKEQNQNELFWEDLQQKFETLQAVTIQIEQILLDHVEQGPEGFRKNLSKLIHDYTIRQGSFLTSFVVENENYFNSLPSKAKGASKKRNYELMVRLSSKDIGLKSMEFIEEFQAIKKKPSKKELQNLKERIRQVYSALKKNLSEKIIQVSEDRSQ